MHNPVCRGSCIEAAQTNQLGNSSKIMVDGVLITTIVIDYSVSTVGTVGEERKREIDRQRDRERERGREREFLDLSFQEHRKRKMLKLDREK